MNFPARRPRPNLVENIAAVTGRGNGGINTGATVDLSSLAPKPQATPEPVRVFNIDEPIPGPFGQVRSVQVDPSLPLEPRTSDELNAMLETRNYALGKGGYATLPTNLNFTQKQNLAAKLADNLEGYDLKYYTDPDGNQGMSWKKPFVDNSRELSPEQMQGLGFPSVRMDYRGDNAPLLNLSNADIQEAKRPLADWDYGTPTPTANDLLYASAKGQTFYGQQDRPAYGFYPASALKGEEIAPKELESIRQVLNQVKANNEVVGGGSKFTSALTEQTMMGDNPMSTAAEMAALDYMQERARTQGTSGSVRGDVVVPVRSNGQRGIETRSFTAHPVQTWVDAPTKEIDALTSSTAQWVDSPDALYSTWKQTPSQSAQMQQGDILRGVLGKQRISSQGAENDYRDFGADLRALAPGMEPEYVTATQRNPAYASSAPTRMTAYQPMRDGEKRVTFDADGYVRDIYRVAPAPVVKALDSAGLARPAYSRDVTDQFINSYPETDRNAAIAFRDFNNPGMPAAFAKPELRDPRGGADLTTLASDRNWSKGVVEGGQVALPSTVLQDKGTSLYELGLPSTINAQKSGTEPEFMSWQERTQKEQDGRMQLDRNPYAEYVNAIEIKDKGNNAPAEVAQFDPEATDLMAAEDGYGKRYRYVEPMADSQDVVDRLSSAQRRANIGYSSERNQTAQRANLRDIEGGGYSVPLTQQQKSQRLSASAMIQNALDDPNLSPDLRERLNNVHMKLGVGPVSRLAKMQSNRDEYGMRVAQAEQAIAQAYGNAPETEKVRVNLISPKGAQQTVVRDMSANEVLQNSRNLREAGYGQLETVLPAENRMAQVQIGDENINKNLVFPSSAKRISTGDKGTRFYTPSNGGSTVQVYNLSPAQQAQMQAEINQGLRKEMPIAIKNPTITSANEFTIDGEGTGIAQQAPVVLGKYGLDPDREYNSEASLSTMQVKPLYNTSGEYARQTSGQRLRSEAGGKTQSVLMEQELMKRRDAMLQQKFGDNWRNYVVQ